MASLPALIPPSELLVRLVNKMREGGCTTAGDVTLLSIAIVGWVIGIVKVGTDELEYLELGMGRLAFL